MKLQSDESRANPRARSAKLRAASRTAAPAWSDPDLSASAAPGPTTAEQGSARP